MSFSMLRRFNVGEFPAARLDQYQLQVCKHKWALGALRLLSSTPIARKCEYCGRVEYQSQGFWIAALKGRGQ